MIPSKVGIEFSAKLLYSLISAKASLSFSSGSFTSIFASFNFTTLPIDAFIQKLYFPINVGVIFKISLEITN